MVLAASLGVGSAALPGCLLNGPFAPDDAEFRPFHPPVILRSTPLAERFVEVPMSGSVSFQVCVTTDSRAPLTARVFIDRARPMCTPGANCGSPAVPQMSVLFNDAGPCREMSFTVPVSNFVLLAGRRCIPLDLYVTSAFKPMQDQMTDDQPERAGDIAHVRWYLVRSIGGIPTIDECCANFGAADALLVEGCTR